MRYGDLKTTKTRRETTADIRETFGKWPEVERFDVRTGLTDAEVLFTVNGQQQRLACDKFYDVGANLRAIYLALEATRKAAQRGILEELATVVAALLPAGRQKRPAHEVLEVHPNASVGVAEASYRHLAKIRHPDKGGSDGAMAELSEAMEEFRRAAAKGAPS